MRGEFRGLGTYTVTVDPGVRDSYGQTLTREYRTTFTVRPLEPALILDGVVRDPVVLEPSHRGVLDLKATGLSQVELRTRALAPADLPHVLRERSSYNRYQEDPWPSPLRGVKSTVFDVPGSRAEPVLLPVPIHDAATMPGQLLMLGARSNKIVDGSWNYRQQVDNIVQVTRLGISAALDSDSGVVLITDLVTGEPLPGVDLALHILRQDAPVWTGRSDARGLAELTHGDINDQPYLVARTAEDLAYLPLQDSLDGDWMVWHSNAAEDEPRAFFFTDRQPYKPGETVHLSAVVRQETRGPRGGVAAYRSDVECDYKLVGPRGHEVAAGKLKVGKLGTFSVDLPLPAGGDLGQYSFQLTYPGGFVSGERSFWHSFAVEAYRAPEFEVKVERPQAATLVYGDTLAAEVRAHYLHGAAMIEAPVGMRVPGA